MSNLRVAKRYASALMVLADESKNTEAVAGDLLTVQSALKASKELRSFLASPVVSKEKKKGVLAEVFRKKVGKEVEGYLSAIIDKGREGLLGEILAEYFLLRDEELGIISVDIRTATEFSQSQEKALTKQLETFTRKKVRVTFSLDTMLKGGFVAKIGDTTLDGSIKRQLEILRGRLKNGSASKN